MIKTSYQSLSIQHQAHFRVNPKSFFFKMSDSAKELSEIKERELMKLI